MRRFIFYLALTLCITASTYAYQNAEGWKDFGTIAEDAATPILITPESCFGETLTKSWKVHYSFSDETWTNVMYYIAGDSTINDKKYRVVVDDIPSGRDSLFYREEGSLLYLLDTSTMEEQLIEHDEEWQEGIGSTSWGIVPLSVVQELLGITPKGTTISNATLMYAWNALNFEDYWRTATINEPCYKLQLMTECREATEYEISKMMEDGRYSKVRNGTPVLEYSFDGDTLCIKGFVLMDTFEFTECVIHNNTVQVRVFEDKPFGFPGTDGVIIKRVDVRFGSFAPGTYYIGKDRIELTCEGGNTSSITPTTPGTSSVTYDLQGRRLPATPRRGLYIKDGRKIVVR